MSVKVPPLTRYSGNAHTETFEEWHEQFPLVETVCRWDDHLKLANLETQLQGQAYSFYHACLQHQRATYERVLWQHDPRCFSQFEFR